MTEAQYVTNIIKELEAIGAKAVKFVENEYTEKGTPDIIGCYKGCCFVIEAKVGNNTPTAIQVQRMYEWHNADAIGLYATYPTFTAKEMAHAIQQIVETST